MAIIFEVLTTNNVFNFFKRKITLFLKKKGIKPSFVQSGAFYNLKLKEYPGFFSVDSKFPRVFISLGTNIVCKFYHEIFKTLIKDITDKPENPI